MRKRDTCKTHQDGIENIVDRLEHDIIVEWDGVEPRYMYQLGDTVYETDVIAGKDYRMFVFEYKCHDSPKAREKAEEQLERVKWWFELQGFRVTPFYVHDNMVYEYMSLE